MSLQKVVQTRIKLVSNFINDGLDAAQKLRSSWALEEVIIGFEVTSTGFAVDGIITAMFPHSFAAR